MTKELNAKQNQVLKAFDRAPTGSLKRAALLMSVDLAAVREGLENSDAFIVRYAATFACPDSPDGAKEALDTCRAILNGKGTTPKTRRYVVATVAGTVEDFASDKGGEWGGVLEDAEALLRELEDVT